MDKRTKIALLALLALGIYAARLKRVSKAKPRLVVSNSYTRPARPAPEPPITPRPPVDGLKVIPFHWFLDAPRTNISADDKPLDLIEGA